MRILIIRTTPNVVNLKTYNLQEVGLAKALVRKGHQCDVMYYCGKENDHLQIIKFDENKEIQILWLHGFGMFYEGIYPSLKKYVNNYDIIQVGGYIGITSRWLNTHVQNKVINYQGAYYCPDNIGDIKKSKIWDTILLPFSNKKNMIVATKSVLATEYIKGKGIQDVTTIGVGLDLSNLEKENNITLDFIEKLKTDKRGNKYLLYIGVLEPRRNIEFLLETYKKVMKQIPESKLILVGKGKEEYVKQCFDKIDQLGLSNNIFYYESIEQNYIKDIYQISDAFLLPTRYEIFGMVLLEAMYYKLPVFTTYNGGSSTLMNEKNGIIIKEFDSEIWCEKICEVLSNKSLKITIGENAYDTIVKGFTWDKLAEKFIEVYEKRISYENKVSKDF